ncbi:MAG: sugar phosphate isomerase/epimerase family protein [Victivallaceae bacterium]
MKHYKAINYWVLGGFSGEKSAIDAINDAKSMELDGIELTFDGCIKTDITEKGCRAIADYAKAQGIGLRSMATGAYWGLSLGSPDSAVRGQAIEFTKKYLQAANWLGVESILVVPGAVQVSWDPSQPVIPYQEMWDNSTDSLKQLLPLAEKLKVNICIENVWNKFLLSPVEMKYYIDQFKSDFIGSYFDVGNVMLNGFPEHWIAILGKRIKAVHFKNYRGQDCGGGLHGFGDDLTDGEVNFKQVIAELDKIGFTGPITAEMIPFCRLPDLVLPDMELARDTARKIKTIA